MCQIFAGTAAKITDVLLNKPGVLDSLFKRNHDGLGAMYATSKHVLKMPKIVPNTVEEARAFIAQLPADERNLVIHFRFKTSGKIDHDNAHPFVVLDGTMAMTHNGVLSISTKSDETKCDTRHYIERYLRPMLGVAPQMARVPEWLELVGGDIGSNRFVFMDNEGFISYVNHHTGYQMDGYWFANTYSFDAALVDDQFKPKATTYTTGGYSGGMWRGNQTPSARDFDWGDEDETLYGGNVRPIGTAKKPALKKQSAAQKKRQADLDAAFGVKIATTTVTPPDAALMQEMADDIWSAVRAADADVMTDYLKEAPITTLSTLFRECDYVPFVDKDGDPHTEVTQGFMKALVDRDMNAVLAQVGGVPSRYQRLACAICWYGDWVGRAINEKDTPLPPVDMTAADNLADALAEAENRAQALEELTADLDSIDSDLVDQRALLVLAISPADITRIQTDIDSLELERAVIENEIDTLEDEASEQLRNLMNVELSDDGAVDTSAATQAVVEEYQQSAERVLA